VLATALAGRPVVAVEAAWALGEIGPAAGTSIVRTLERAAGGASASVGLAPPAGRAAVVALLFSASRLRPVPLGVVSPFLASPDRDVAWSAAYAIARPRVPAGVRAILPLARHSDAEVRALVARALARPAAGDSLAAAAVAALRVLIADTSPHVRINAVRSLATFGTDVRTEVTALVRDRDANVRIATAQSLTTVMDSNGARWAALWDADTGYMFRRSLLESAMRLGVRLSALGTWKDSADWRYRAAVAEAGGAATDPARIRDISLPLADDRDGRVRTAAWSAFASHVDSSADHPWLREFMLRGLPDPDPQVRATVLGALAGEARAAELPAVLFSYALARTDSTNDARLAAVHYLARVWRRDSAGISDSLRGVLRALPAPADPLERAEGQGIPLFRSWPGTQGTPRPIAWYLDVVRAIVLPSLAGAGPVAEIRTARGTIVVELYGADAPLTVANFLTLARSGWYADTRFHRVVPNFVIQDGDPRGDGNGGPGWAIRDEFNRRRYDRGAVGMALSGPETGGSQYFITHAPQPHLDGHYTVFGHVRSGWDVLDALVQGDRILTVTIR
jgi:cyclophilin family peptidyl-prolyl cis-trans isomerase/HEAT repeat protein